MKKIMFSDKYCLTLAVLYGIKTMTRRLLKVPKTCNGKEVYSFNVLTNNAGTQCVDLVDENGGILESWKPHYEVGEIVAIAQCYKEVYPNAGFEMVDGNFMTESAGWTNKMFVKANLLPHHIRITDVNVERLQSISDEDILREGVWQFYDNKNLFYVSKNIGYAPDVAFLSAREAFWYLIDNISGKGTWESNPWVVAYSFELID
jgi:hypothetical protein